MPPTQPLAISAFDPPAEAPPGGADAEHVAQHIARRRAALRDRHWTMLVICAIVVALSLALQLDGGGRVTATRRWPLPMMCGSRAAGRQDCAATGSAGAVPGASASMKPCVAYSAMEVTPERMKLDT